MQPRVRAIIMQDNKLLLVRHIGRNGKPENVWALPGGGVDDGEMLLDAVYREMVEETGIAPVVGKLLYVHQFKYQGKYQGPEFFFHIENAKDYEDIDLAATTHGLQEIAEIGFRDPKELHVLPAFLKDISKIDPRSATKLVIRTEEENE